MLVLNIQVCVRSALITIPEHFGLLFSNQRYKREGSTKRKQRGCDRDKDLLGSPPLHLSFHFPLFLSQFPPWSHQSGSSLICLPVSFLSLFLLIFFYSFLPFLLFSFLASINIHLMITMYKALCWPWKHGHEYRIWALKKLCTGCQGSSKEKQRTQPEG